MGIKFKWVTSKGIMFKDVTSKLGYVQEGVTCTFKRGYVKGELRSRGITTKGGKSKGDNISSQHNSETAGRYANFLVEGGGG